MPGLCPSASQWSRSVYQLNVFLTWSHAPTSSSTIILRMKGKSSHSVTCLTLLMISAHGFKFEKHSSVDTHYYIDELLTAQKWNGNPGKKRRKNGDVCPCTVCTTYDVLGHNKNLHYYSQCHDLTRVRTFEKTEVVQVYVPVHLCIYSVSTECFSNLKPCA